MKMDYLNPQNPFQTIHYKIAYKLFLFFRNKNHSNIIIYGKRGSGKSLLMKTIFKEKYEGKPSIKTNDHYSYIEHTNYYLFNCASIHNKVAFTEYIKDIVQTYDYYNEQCKYVILDHFEKLNETMQNILKVIIEKAYFTCKFIIISNKYNRILPAIKSRCIGIRIPEPSHYDKLFYMKTLLKDKFSISEFHLLEDCKQYDLDQLIYRYCIDTKTINIQDDLYKTMKDIIYHSKISSKEIMKLKKLTSEIKEINIPLIEFVNCFILESPSKKCIPMIQLCNRYDSQMNHSYRELIHMESLIIHLNLIFNDIKVRYY